MKIQEIIAILESLAPLAYAENFDNVGLLVGDSQMQCSGILVCHDALELVIDEAVTKNCNFVVCFHPIIFSGLKSLTGKNYVERAVMKAIRHDIAIYAVHTALDNHQQGVNKVFADALGLVNTHILIPKEHFIQKLITYTIPENVEKVRHALFEAGAGTIGNYDHCSFTSEGISTFVPNEGSTPVIGEQGKMTTGKEIKIEVTFKKHQQKGILKALFDHHVYEEVAYELYDLLNKHQHIGLGMIGELPTALSESDFFQMVKEKMKVSQIRHSELLNKNINKVAVLGGSGSFAIGQAIQAGADVFLTADLKYHNFYEAEHRIVLADIGHYESERYTKNYIVEFLRKKMPNFAIILSEINTNPVKYL